MSTPYQSPDEIRAERRRERWHAFWTPFIALASVVGSVAMLMYLLKSCSERFSQAP